MDSTTKQQEEKPGQTGPRFPLTVSPGLLEIAEGVRVGVRRLRSSDLARAMASAGITAEEMQAEGPRSMLFAIKLARIAVISVDGKPVALERDAELGKVCPEGVIDDLIDRAPASDKPGEESMGGLAAIIAEAMAGAAVSEVDAKKS